MRTPAAFCLFRANSRGLIRLPAWRQRAVLSSGATDLREDIVGEERNDGSEGKNGSEIIHKGKRWKWSMGMSRDSAIALRFEWACQVFWRRNFSVNCRATVSHRGGATGATWCSTNPGFFGILLKRSVTSTLTCCLLHVTAPYYRVSYPISQSSAERVSTTNIKLCTILLVGPIAVWNDKLYG